MGCIGGLEGSGRARQAKESQAGHSASSQGHHPMGQKRFCFRETFTSIHSNKLQAIFLIIGFGIDQQVKHEIFCLKNFMGYP